MLRLIVAASVILMPLAACQAGVGSPSSVARAELLPLTVHTSRGEWSYRVEVARTPEEQALGLMYRTSLPADGGMLFLFDPPRPASFWMKNTRIPLDMIFIRADGTIARIAARTTPESLDQITSGEPVAAVLEIAGGGAAAAGIGEGDRISWRLPGDSPSARLREHGDGR